jgi:hypothetical protein
MTKLQQKLKVHIIEDIIQDIDNAILNIGCLEFIEDTKVHTKMTFPQLEEDLKTYRKRLMRIRRQIKNMETNEENKT